MTEERIRRQIDILLSEAEIALRELDWDTVRRRFQAVLALDPANGDALAYARVGERQTGGRSAERLGFNDAAELTPEPPHREIPRWEYSEEYVDFTHTRGESDASGGRLRFYWNDMWGNNRDEERAWAEAWARVQPVLMARINSLAADGWQPTIPIDARTLAYEAGDDSSGRLIAWVLVVPLIMAGIAAAVSGTAPLGIALFLSAGRHRQSCARALRRSASASTLPRSISMSLSSGASSVPCASTNNCDGPTAPPKSLELGLTDTRRRIMPVD